MDDSDEFSIVFDPCKELCEKNNIKIGSDAWYINFIQSFFDPSCAEVNLIEGFFCVILGCSYDMKYSDLCNWATFKNKVEIKENIINKMDKSIVDVNVGDIIKFNVGELESIFGLTYDQKTQRDIDRINFFTDCLKSLILCLYVKHEFDTTDEKEKKEKEKKERLKQILIDTFLNMLVHLSLSPFLVNNNMSVDNINFIKQFCGKEAFDGLHSKLYGYICKFLIKNADKPLNFQQQAEYIQQFLDITLKLNGKNVKLSDKIKLVDEDSNIIELDNGKIPAIEIKEKKFYFKVVDDRFKETIIFHFNIFDDKDLQSLEVSIDTRGNIKSVKEEDQLSSDELNDLNKLLLGTKLFSDKAQGDLICILLGIYLKRKNKINDIMSKNADIDIKDILKSFFSEMLEGKNKKSIVAEFKNLKAKNIPNGIYSQLAKIAICCDADSQENFWRKDGDNNGSKFSDKIKIECNELKDNKDQLWNWIQTELFVTITNKKIDSNKKLKADLENAIVNDLPKDKSLFQSLNEFVTFLPTKLKKYFTKEKIQEILGKEWGNFEIQDDYLEKLYEIDLSPETKTKIIKKFNMRKAKSFEDQLKNENDVKKAIDTFKKILGENKVSALDFRNFICFNISAGALSSKDMDAILDYVDCNKKENVFQGLTFWNTFNVLKEQPSKKFMEFMVKNTNFGDLDQKHLITNIIALMQKHPEYQKNNEKNGMLLALKDILCGEDYYQGFSSALLNVKNIADKINDDNIAAAAAAAAFSGYIMNFVKDLMFYGIKIKLEVTDQNKKFTVCEEEYQCSNDSLIKLLSKEPDLNNWLKAIFAKNEENKEITTLADLVSKMSKPKAIKNFINNSKNSERLKKIYKPLLENDDLLNNVPLNKDTVERCMREIRSSVDSGSLTFDKNKFEEVKTSLESWNVDLKDEQLKYEMICSIVAFFFEDIEKCNSSLYNEKFINMVAEMTQNPKLNIYLDKYEKDFFSYIKEQLLKVKGNKKLENHLSIYLENKNRDSEINRLQQESKDKNRMDRIYSLKQPGNGCASERDNLQQTISFYKWLYLFALVPVLGWIFCAILYFYFHKPCLNRLGQLRQNQETISKDLSPLEAAQETISNRLNQLMQERTESRKQSEQLKDNCQTLLSFIDSKEQIPPENIIIDNKQNNNLSNSGEPKLLSENNIITIENKF